MYNCEHYSLDAIYIWLFCDLLLYRVRFLLKMCLPSVALRLVYLLGCWTQNQCLGTLSFRNISLSRRICCGGSGVRYISSQRRYRDRDRFLSLKAPAAAVMLPHFVGALASCGLSYRVLNGARMKGRHSHWKRLLQFLSVRAS